MKIFAVIFLLLLSNFSYSQNNHIFYSNQIRTESSNISPKNRIDSLNKTTHYLPYLFKGTNFWDFIQNKKDSSIYISRDNRKWKHTYKYFTDTRVIETSTMEWINDRWENYSKWIYEYDTTGINVRTTVIDWEENEWKFRNRYTKEFDTFGNQILFWNSKNKCFWENLQLIKNSKYKICYAIKQFFY